jgi:uncharacterized protein (DUF2235 family)
MVRTARGDPEPTPAASRGLEGPSRARFRTVSLAFAAAGLALLAVRSLAASEGPPPMNPRRLVLCLDGTWNSTYVQKKRDDGHHVLKPSNVLKLCRAVLPFDAGTGREQVAWYDVGVGSLSRFPGTSNRLLAGADKMLGGAFGAGFESNVEEAMNFLVLNYRMGDELYIFGFSRGAATARALTRFIDWAGGLPAKRDSYYLPRLFREYIEARGENSVAEVVRAINADRAREKSPREPLGPFEPVEVRFLGVWDTVMALGSRFRGAGEGTSTASRSFHVGPQPASIVRHARQAVAIDEARYDFRPEVWSSAKPGQTLEQRWFAGVHSNVGGGYIDDGLANLAFHWILDEAAKQGLAVDREFAGIYRRYPQDRLYRSESLTYRILDSVRLRYGRGRRSLLDWPETANLSLSPSVIHRLQSDPEARLENGSLRFPDMKNRYRPENVLRFLACQADLDAYLQSLGLDEPKSRELPADVVTRIAGLKKDC